MIDLLFVTEMYYSYFFNINVPQATKYVVELVVAAEWQLVSGEAGGQMLQMQSLKWELVVSSLFYRLPRF